MSCVSPACDRLKISQLIHRLRNSNYGGACLLEIISAPNDDVLKEILNSVPEKISGSSNNA